MVEWKKLGEVCVIKTGKGITQKDCSEDGAYPVISGGKAPMGNYIQYNREANTVTISRVGAYAGFVSFIKERFYLNDKCFSIIPFSNTLDSQYIYCILKAQEENIKKLQSEGGVPTINTQKLGNLVIPIPSLSEQQRIVSILDTFTSSIDNLKQQIELRKKQYEHYRNQLLDLEGKEGVEMKTLGEICEFRSGWGFPKKYQGLKKGIYPFYKVGDMNNCTKYLGNANNYINEEIAKVLGCKPAPQGTIIFPKIGAAMATNKKRILSQQSCYDNNVMGVIAKGINSALLYYLLSGVRLLDFANGKGAIPSLDRSKMVNYSIPLPPLSTQRRIVSILDTFESSIRNLEEQLKQRQQQYEYYREKLLTFE